MVTLEKEEEEEEDKHCSATPRRKDKVVVVGDSILQGTEGPIYCPDP